jgi:succinyl-diaminopimelate desuccinylase
VEKTGLESELLAWAPVREQLVARTPDIAAPPLTFTGHLDAVRVELADWSLDPYAAERDGDEVGGSRGERV